MIYFDTYVILDLFSGEKELVRKARRHLRVASEEGCAISTVGLTEVVFHLIRKGFGEVVEDFLLFVRTFQKLRVINVDEEIAVKAGKIRGKYYNKSECELSFLDCIHIATALIAGCAKIVTGDRDFSRVKEIEVEVYS